MSTHVSPTRHVKLEPTEVSLPGSMSPAQGSLDSRSVSTGLRRTPIPMPTVTTGATASRNSDVLVVQIPSLMDNANRSSVPSVSASASANVTINPFTNLGASLNANANANYSHTNRNTSTNTTSTSTSTSNSNNMISNNPKQPLLTSHLNSRSNPNNSSHPNPNPNSSLSPRTRTELSSSIQVHADVIMQLIREERALAVRGTTKEMEGLARLVNELGRELESVKNESEGLRSRVKELGEKEEAKVKEEEEEEEEEREAKEQVAEEEEGRRELRGWVETTRYAAGVMEGQYKLLREELENVKRENEQLRDALSKASANAGTPTSESSADSKPGAEKKVGGEDEETDTNTNVQTENGARDADSDVEGKMDAYMKRRLGKRCEELERENERLRTSEANLLQRVEMLESLTAVTSTNSGAGATVSEGLVVGTAGSAATAMQSTTEGLPDLSGALEVLKAYLFNHQGGINAVDQAQEAVQTQAKKRKLDVT